LLNVVNWKGKASDKWTGKALRSALPFFKKQYNGKKENGNRLRMQ
jgi:hypothetical protein